MLAAATLEVLILTDSGEFDDSAHRQRDGEDEEKCCKLNSLLSLWILEINLILSQFSVSEFPQSV